MATLRGRVEALERHRTDAMPKVFRIKCAGESPTTDEQARIDEALAEGALVLCRTIVQPPDYSNAIPLIGV